MKNNQLTYHNQIVPYSRDELVAKLKNALTDSRFQHVLRVEQTAMDLAERNGVDVEKASIGGLVHDYAKQRPDKDFIEAIKTYHWTPNCSTMVMQFGTVLWDGYLSKQN